MDLSKYVTDEDAPQLGNGEVVFTKISETDEDASDDSGNHQNDWFYSYK